MEMNASPVMMVPVSSLSPHPQLGKHVLVDTKQAFANTQDEFSSNQWGHEQSFSPSVQNLA